ncbi:glycoside hydrolase domain-containing protein [Halosolutus amylolyticus]|uniref:Glycoside hydrolase domain-containing protein n=1 Tax=Halosolutus amylolyticus TaxID=2932267 RepID=A0ABD5PIU3_9EURY|nr:glycoside hydrolase domain-containing protein [Halosolutus amylolyticus]
MQRRKYLEGLAGATGIVTVTPTGKTQGPDDREEGSSAKSATQGSDGPPGLERKGDTTPEWVQFLVEKAMPQEGLNTWVPTGSFGTSSSARVDRFPQDFGVTDQRNLSLIAARNEQVSGQVAVLSNDPIDELSCSVSDLESGTSGRIPADDIQVRYVGYVPIENAHSEHVWSATFEEVADDPVGTRSPDFVGDPLLEVNSIPVPAYAAQPIWFTINVPKTAPPGTYKGAITVDAGDQGTVHYALDLDVYDVALPDPADYEFYLDIWMNANAIAAEHSVNRRSADVQPWSTRHWELIEAYMRDMAKRGQKSITATIIHEPWQREWLEGAWRSQTEIGYESMVEWRYDGQNWSFDFSIFDQFVETGLEQGMGPDIAAYSMLVFRGSQRITYVDEREGERAIWNGEAGDPFWQEAWTAFLEAFQPHLEEKGWLERTYIAFDERPEELMQEVIELLEAVAPVFVDRLHIAGSMDVEDIAHNVAAHYGHLPIDQDIVDRRREDEKITTFYTAGGQSHPNTFSFSPPVEARMLPWISALNDLDGYLRWAYNSWPTDVYENPVFRYVQGDEYFVYPGEDGPISSLSWEQLTEGIEEYELVRMLREREGGDTAVLKNALELATRDRDAREKDLRDVVEAKEIVLKELAGN